MSRQIKEDEAAAVATSDQTSENSTVVTSGSDLVLEDEVKLEQVNASSTVEVKKAHSGGHKPGAWTLMRGSFITLAAVLKWPIFVLLASHY